MMPWYCQPVLQGQFTLPNIINNWKNQRFTEQNPAPTADHLRKHEAHCLGMVYVGPLIAALAPA